MIEKEKNLSSFIPESIQQWVWWQAAINYTLVDAPYISLPEKIFFLLPEKDQQETIFGNISSRHKIERKIRHTHHVISKTYEIMEKIDWQTEEGEPWNINLALTAAFVHDCKRFEEVIVTGMTNAADHGFNFGHAQKGAMAFLQGFKRGTFPELSDKDCCLLYEAVFHHQDKEYTGSNPYTKLLRDADTLANAYNMDYLLEMIESDEFLTREGLSPSVLDEFKTTGLVSNKNTHTRLDVLLKIISWYSSLNFQASKKIWEENNCTAQLLAQMKQWGADEQTVEIITERILKEN